MGKSLGARFFMAHCVVCSCAISSRHSHLADRDGNTKAKTPKNSYKDQSSSCYDDLQATALQYCLIRHMHVCCQPISHYAAPLQSGDKTNATSAY